MPPAHTAPQPRPRPEDLLRPGSVFAGRYQIEALIGQGGMGTVFRARDLNLGEPVALKILPFEPDAQPMLAMRFRQEVKLARRVTHPNVVRVHDIGEEQGLLYLTMELVDGETLRAILRAEKRIPPARAAAIALAIAEGLRAAHAVGVIHRDLKPSNILVDPRGRILISDFGIARCADEDLQLTQGPVGTPSYMAPEQAASAPVDERADVYALGLLMYEMLTGERPAGSAAEIAARIHAEAPQGIAPIVLRCLSFRPEDRPRSEEVARQLAHAAPDIEDAATVALAPQACGAQALPPAAPGTHPSSPHPSSPTPPSSTPRSAQADTPHSRTFTRTERTLAVLPFRYRGPKEQDYLGDALSDELVDVLSRTRGLRVLGTGVTTRFRESRDPMAIGRELHAYAVIDGTIQVMGERIRNTVRLLDAASGVQIWCESHEGGLSDAFTFQESIARKVAEALRVELTTRLHGETAPAEVIERYLTARRELRNVEARSAQRAAELLEGALTLAPDFTPAMAAHAMACARAWFFRLDTTGGHDWEAEARASAERALERAPELPESHLAAGMIATQRGDYAAAAIALARALAIAPTFADAHEYLGMLQCEGGHVEEGLRHLRIAGELDPTLSYCALFTARYHALRGDWEACGAGLREFDRRRTAAQLQYATAIRARFCAWRGDREGLERLTVEPHLADSRYSRLVRLYARACAGDASREEVDAFFQKSIADSRSPRNVSFLYQIWAEICAASGWHAEALKHLAESASGTLIDLEWLERCPLFTPLHGRPEYEEARRRVRARANAIWAP